MTSVLLGMGSNIHPEQHLKDAANTIKQKFPNASFSSVYQSAAVGMDGDDFLNACCLLKHDKPAQEFVEWLKELEDKHGRDRSQGSWKPRTLDLDVLIVDDEVVDKDFYKYGHIVKPASDLVQIESSRKMDCTMILKVDVRL